MLPEELALAVINTDVIKCMKMNEMSKVKSEKRAEALRAKPTESCRRKN